MAQVIGKNNQSNLATRIHEGKFYQKVISKAFTINDLSSQENFEFGELNDELADFNHISVTAIVSGYSSGSGELTLEGSPDGTNYVAYDASEFLDSVNTVTVDSDGLYRFSIEIFTDETLRLVLDKSTGSLSGGTIQFILIAKRMY